MTSTSRRPAARAAGALAAALVAASAAAPRTAAAQCITVGCVQVSTARAVVGDVFRFQPAVPPLTQNAQSGNLCSPGFCYTGTVTTKGNRGWQLQVRLASDPGTFYVNYVQTTVPPSAQAVNSGAQTRLSTVTWLTVARATAATGGDVIGVQFNANKVAGNTGVIPTGAQLASVLAWRVVANP